MTQMTSNDSDVEDDDVFLASDDEKILYDVALYSYLLTVSKLSLAFA